MVAPAVAPHIGCYLRISPVKKNWIQPNPSIEKKLVSR
jgi:hypothetical protein